MTAPPIKPPKDTLTDLLAGKVLGPSHLTKRIEAARRAAVEQSDQRIREALDDKIFK